MSVERIILVSSHCFEYADSIYREIHDDKRPITSEGLVCHKHATGKHVNLTLLSYFGNKLGYSDNV